MNERVKIVPSGPTVHIMSPRVKHFGAAERPVTYCGLWLHMHSVIIDRPLGSAEKMCRVCVKRSNPDRGGT